MYLKTEGAAEVLVELFQDNRDVLDDLYVAAFFWVYFGVQPTHSLVLCLSRSHTLSRAHPPSIFLDVPWLVFPMKGLLTKSQKHGLCRIWNMPRWRGRIL